MVSALREIPMREGIVARLPDGLPPSGAKDRVSWGTFLRKRKRKMRKLNQAIQNILGEQFRDNGEKKISLSDIRAELRNRLGEEVCEADLIASLAKLTFFVEWRYRGDEKFYSFGSRGYENWKRFGLAVGEHGQTIYVHPVFLNFMKSSIMALVLGCPFGFFLGVQSGLLISSIFLCFGVAFLLSFICLNFGDGMKSAVIRWTSTKQKEKNEFH